MTPVESNRVTICRRISFSSGHRYFNEELSEEENRRIYGEAYSENGFGHNFVLEAYVEGKIDTKTGMVINLQDLDSVLKGVINPLDHHFLNTDVPYFRKTVPTVENLAVYCFSSIEKKLDQLQVSLRLVRVYEGPDMWVDYPADNII